MENILKETFQDVTDCCGRTPLIEVHSDDCYSLWDFCPNCLRCYELINANEYKEGE